MKHTPRKRFGQNFLQDTGLIDRIVQAINPQIDDHIIEIGPGQGAITRPLLENCAHVDVVEIDRDLAAALPARTATATHRIQTLHQQDVLTLDFSQLNPHQPLRIVGNLPYNISTPLLFHLFTHINAIQDIHVMLQKEVVDRLCAQPHDKSYGRLSVMAQFYCDIDPLLIVPADAFYPKPKVLSAVARLCPKPDETRQLTDIDRLETIAKSAFSQRRKTLRNTLKQHLTEAQLIDCDIDPNARAETLALADFMRLASIL